MIPKLSSPLAVSLIITLPLLLITALLAPDQRGLSDFYKPDKSITKQKLPDFRGFAQVQDKKDAFAGFMLPLIHEANREIAGEREFILSLQSGGDSIEALQDLAEKYRISEGTRDQQITSLLQQVNVIPPSLALAQAANESGWGTSRFARQANNLYGEWCFSEGCGLVPKQRPTGAYHEVASYKTPYHSVQSYMLNINRHDSYAQLRKIRNQQIADQGYATGTALAAGLINYSQRGRAYISEIRGMISVNDYGRYDLPGSENEGSKNEDSENEG